ncbi:MAG: Uma2 family endonuclease [Bacteroidota bacterium]|nr:Uma2 family endonuclease [Bacteroidota bacterium]
MSTSEILEKLVESPNAIKIIEEAQSVFEKEKLERQKFYDLVHENFKSEFINGEIVFHSPVRLRHLIVSTSLTTRLNSYVMERSLGFVGVEKMMIRLTRNDYEPDICFFRKEKAALFTSDQMLFPAPDFIVEILSDSTEKIDRGIKFVDYAAHGVIEYWIIDPIKQTVEKFLLNQNEYFLEVKLQADGKLQSSVVEGFGLELKELF